MATRLFLKGRKRWPAGCAHVCVRMHTCVYVCEIESEWAYMCVCTWLSIWMHLHNCGNVCMHVRKCVCVWAYLCVGDCMRLFAWVYISVCLNVSKCMCTLVYIYLCISMYSYECGCVHGVWDCVNVRAFWLRTWVLMLVYTCVCVWLWTYVCGGLCMCVWLCMGMPLCFSRCIYAKHCMSVPPPFIYWSPDGDVMVFRGVTIGRFDEVTRVGCSWWN